MHRVLVIDDNPDDLALAEVALSRAGFEVLLLDEPLRAVEIATMHEVAAILLERVALAVALLIGEGSVVVAGASTSGPPDTRVERR